MVCWQVEWMRCCCYWSTYFNVLSSLYSPVPLVSYYYCCLVLLVLLLLLLAQLVLLLLYNVAVLPSSSKQCALWRP